MPKLTINNQTVEVPEGYTVLQAAQLVDIEIPVFCFHSRLNIAGNCRMCLVELKNSPKPIASCAMPATEGMVVETKTESVKKAREGVLKFLLLNHPLDCPICDQGGECDLQDITMAYGSPISQYEESKRAVAPKNMGPLIKAFMNRCIHCTRCVRFARDVAGVQEMGAVGRGEHMEITTYLNQTLTSELSGNMVDLCPVGALTSAPYSYKGRPWDLKSTESIDVMDALGSHIRIDTAHMKVMRILPRLNEEINEEWISDKTRYACDALQRQRLDQPYVRQNGQLVPASWEEAFTKIKNSLKKIEGHQIAALAGDFADVESMKILKDICAHYKTPHLECRLDGAYSDPGNRSSYIFNTTIQGIEEADFCFIVGANLRAEAPLIHGRLHKSFLKGGIKIAYLGGALPLHRQFTFDYEDLGDDINLISNFMKDKHPLIAHLKNAKKPMIILGQEVLRRLDGGIIFKHLVDFAEKFSFIQKDWNGFNVLQTSAGRVGGLDIGFVSQKNGKNAKEILSAARLKEIKALYLLGADEIPFEGLESTFMIYQGHHGDKGAHHADVILPGATYTEKNATYVNAEGRVQQTAQALFPPGQAKEDWRILKDLAEFLGISLPYQTLGGVRDHMALDNAVFEPKRLGFCVPTPWKSSGMEGKIEHGTLAPSHNLFYMTDVISRHSPTMARCMREIAVHPVKEAAYA